MRAGLPCFAIVGLADAAVREARERVTAAILNSGYEFPTQRITANLAPGDVRKAGPGLDLALACAVLAAAGQLPREPRSIASHCSESSRSTAPCDPRAARSRSRTRRSARACARSCSPRVRARGATDRRPRGRRSRASAQRRARARRRPRRPGRRACRCSRRRTRRARRERLLERRPPPGGSGPRRRARPAPRGAERS